MIVALAITVLATQVLASRNASQQNTRPYRPTAFNIGPATPEAPCDFKAYRAGSSLGLTPSFSVLTLDYGAEVAGFPYFTVQSITRTTQVELKYSEPYDGLQLPYSDGPFLFVNGLMNSFRTETFNLTAASANAGYGAYFVLKTSGPHFTNTDNTLLPPKTLIAGFGFSIIDQPILASAPPQYYKVPFEISQDRCYRITTTISATGYNISINSTQIAFVDLKKFEGSIDASWGNPRATDGTWGFGPFQDQAAYFRDVVVMASDGKTQLYSDPLTIEDILAKYRVATNSDRVLGLGPMQEAMGDGFEFRSEYYPSQYLENDYEIFFLLIVGDYFALTEDTNFMREHWGDLKTLVETLIERFLDPASGLLADPNRVLWFTAQGAQNATAPTALFVVALQELVPIAEPLHDSGTVKLWKDLIHEISTTINQKLWSDSLGTYIFALDDPGNYSLLSAAFPICAGIANTSQATRSIQSLSNLFLKIGYKDSTQIGNSNTTQLSPNVQGFLLESIFLAHTNLNVSAEVVTPVIEDLSEVYWPHMVNQNEYFTGCPWEYMYPDGSPGIGIFTSLCHPWGGAPTYILSNYILGIRRELNDHGSYEWVLDPVWEVIKGLSLEQASGRMPLLQGGWIEAMVATASRQDPM